MSSPLEQFITNLRNAIIVNPKTELTPQIFKDVVSTQTTPSDVGAKLDALIAFLKRRTPLPVVDFIVDTLPLNNATEDAILQRGRVPPGMRVQLRNMDLVYTSTGSFRVKWQQVGTRAVNIIENTATDLHWYGYVVCPGGTELQITQGTTTSGTGNITGVVCGDATQE